MLRSLRELGERSTRRSGARADRVDWRSVCLTAQPTTGGYRMDVHDRPCTDFSRCRVEAPWQGHWRRRAGRDSSDLCCRSRRARGRASPRPQPSSSSTTRSRDTVATPFRSFLFTLRLVTLVWFVVGLSVLLRRAEGEAAWRSAIAMGSGVLFVALGLSGLGNEAAVALRAGDLDSQIARYAFDQGQAAFANGRAALGSFAVAAAGSSRRHDSCPAGWDGWRSQAERGSHLAVSAGLAPFGWRPI
jgi:hypothetical protein